MVTAEHQKIKKLHSAGHLYRAILWILDCKFLECFNGTRIVTAVSVNGFKSHFDGHCSHLCYYTKAEELCL